MPQKCCVPACRGNYLTGPRVSIFKFPVEKSIREKWLHAIHRDNFTPSHLSVVCELHFQPHDIERSTSMYDTKKGKLLTAPLDRPRLKKGAVPTQLPNQAQNFFDTTLVSRENSEDRRLNRQIKFTSNTVIMKKEALQNLVPLIDIKEEQKVKLDGFAIGEFEDKPCDGFQFGSIKKELIDDFEMSSNEEKDNFELELSAIKQEPNDNSVLSLFEGKHCESFIKSEREDYPLHAAEDTEEITIDEFKLELEDGIDVNASYETDDNFEATSEISNQEALDMEASNLEHLFDQELRPCEETNVENLECNICGQNFRLRDVFTKHMLMHSNHKQHVCDSCGKVFSSLACLGDHTSICFKSLKCRTCQKCFKNLGTFTCHMMIHSGLQAHICDICEKCFLDHAAHAEHMLSHSSQTVHECAVCGKCFLDLAAHAEHMLSHSSQTVQECAVCGKCFLDHAAHAEHLLSHSSKIVHECAVCGKCYKYLGTYINHLRIHSSTYGYSCNMCNKSFTKHSQIASHMRRHLVINLHKCNICGRKYKRQTSYKRHMLVHSDIIPR